MASYGQGARPRSRVLQDRFVLRQHSGRRRNRPSEVSGRRGPHGCVQGEVSLSDRAQHVVTSRSRPDSLCPVELRPRDFVRRECVVGQGGRRRRRRLRVMLCIARLDNRVRIASNRFRRDRLEPLVAIANRRGKLRSVSKHAMMPQIICARVLARLAVGLGRCRR